LIKHKIKPNKDATPKATQIDFKFASIGPLQKNQGANIHNEKYAKKKVHVIENKKTREISYKMSRKANWKKSYFYLY